MEFLNKIETFINQLLFKLGELILRLVPLPLKKFFLKISHFSTLMIGFLKKSPFILKDRAIALIGSAKEVSKSLDIKGALKESYQKAMAQHAAETEGKTSKLKTLLLAPFLVMGQWLQDLNPVQTLVLLTFSGLSILSVIGIGYSGKRLTDSYRGADRIPASVEEVVEYERPDYYKKEQRHYEITNFRLPVYVPQVNEIKSVDIDFTATLSNRNARMFLEKNEFHLRDHLIINVEPSIASFPLEEEGKEIIRKKIWSDVNDFLKLKGVEGEVIELKITYVLAN